jgi:hypothetical protein
VALAGDDGVAVVLAMTGTAAVVALGGWGAAALRNRRDPEAGLPPDTTTAIERVGIVLVAVAAAGAAFIAPVIGVFAAMLFLNHTLGRGENVPFARYKMFAKPGRRSWALRYEDSAGSRLNIGSLGIMPPAARKRFAGQLAAERGQPGEGDAHERAAQVIATWIGERRPATGRLSTEPITIVFVEYEFEGGTIHTQRRPLAVARPS